MLALIKTRVYIFITSLFRQSTTQVKFGSCIPIVCFNISEAFNYDTKAAVAWLLG